MKGHVVFRRNSCCNKARRYRGFGSSRGALAVVCRVGNSRVFGGRGHAGSGRAHVMAVQNDVTRIVIVQEVFLVAVAVEEVVVCAVAVEDAVALAVVVQKVA